MKMYKPDFIKYFARKKRSRSSYIARVIGGIVFSLAVSGAAFMLVSAEDIEKYDNDTVAFVLAKSGDNDDEDNDGIGPDPADENGEEQIIADKQEWIEIDDEEVPLGGWGIELEALSDYEIAFETAFENYQELYAAFLEGEIDYDELEEAYAALIKAHVALQGGEGDFEADLEDYINARRAYRAAQAAYASALAEYEAAQAGYSEALAQYESDMEQYRQDLTEYADALSAYTKQVADFGIAQAAYDIALLSGGADDMEVPEAPADPQLIRPDRPKAPAELESSAPAAPDKFETPGIFSIDGVELPV